MIEKLLKFNLQRFAEEGDPQGPADPETPELMLTV